MSHNRPDIVYLADGSAWRIGPGGQRVAVKAIRVPQKDDCCFLDCCGDAPAIVYNSPRTGGQVRIPLEDLADLLSLVAASSSAAPASSSPDMVTSSSNPISSSVVASSSDSLSSSNAAASSSTPASSSDSLSSSNAASSSVVASSSGA